jgi:hypothetical protein
MTKSEKLLEQARADLDGINDALMVLEAAKADASKTSATFAEWRSSVEKQTGERERLSILIAAFEIEIEQQRKDAARADLMSRRATLEKQTYALARRIRLDGAKAAELLVQLTEEASANARAVAEFNRELGHGEPLEHADHIARYRDPKPRQDLSEEITDLWCFERTGQLAGDQDAVIALANGRGIIPATEHSLTNKPVVRKKYRQVRYLAAGHREYVDPLASILRLPRFDQPGTLYDRGNRLEPARRKELMELIPVPDAPAKPAKSPDGRT